MFPVLFSIGKFSISSFGFFLALAFLYAIFLVWRQARAAEMDEEKVLDLSLLTFLGGFIGARMYFVLENLEIFTFDLVKWIHFLKFPGFSFWGGFLGGWITLYYLCKRFKLDFWQMADLAVVAFLGGLIMGDLGCFLGVCSVGIRSEFLGVEMVGIVEKRFPIQLFEAMALSLVLLKLWPGAIHFHLRGKIISKGLIFLGIIKFLTEFLKEGTGNGFIFSSVLIILGTVIHYTVVKTPERGGRKQFIEDIKWLISFPFKFVLEKEVREKVLVDLQKNWYNRRVEILWKWKNFQKIMSPDKLLRRMRVKTTIKNS